MEQYSSKKKTRHRAGRIRKIPHIQHIQLHKTTIQLDYYDR